MTGRQREEVTAVRARDEGEFQKKKDRDTQSYIGHESQRGQFKRYENWRSEGWGH